MIHPIQDNITPLPFRDELRGYSLQHLRSDLLAGITVAVFAVPQAMAYAIVAGMAPAFGLHSAIVMSIVAALWGSSRFVNTGPTNSSALLAGGVLLAASPGGSLLSTAFHLTLLVGLIRMSMGLLRLGWFVRFIPRSTFLGFMAGAGCLIALGQLHHLLGVPASKHPLFLPRMLEVLRHAPQANPYAVALGSATFLTILALRRHTQRWPVALIAIVGATLIAGALGPGSGILLVRDIAPLRDTLPHWENFRLQIPLLLDLLPVALAIALVGIVEAVSIGDTLALRHQQRINVNQEFFGQGLSQCVAAFFHGFPGSGSFTRSALVEQTGGRTRLANVFFGIFTALVLVCLPGWLGGIPVAALAGMLLYIGIRLADVPRLQLVLGASRSDAIMLAATFLVTVFVRIEYGLFVGALIGMAAFLHRASSVRIYELLPNAAGGFREQPYEPGSAHAPSALVAIAVHGNLFFGLAQSLHDQLAEVGRVQQPRFVILRLRRAYSIDYSCWRSILDFAEDFHRQGGKLFLCGVSERFVRTLRKAGMEEILPGERIFEQESTPFRALDAAVEEVRRQIPSGLALSPAWAERMLQSRTGKTE